MWKSEGQLQELVLLSHHVGRRDQTWVARLDDRLLCLLSSLVGPWCGVLPEATHLSSKKLQVLVFKTEVFNLHDVLQNFPVFLTFEAGGLCARDGTHRFAYASILPLHTCQHSHLQIF